MKSSAASAPFLLFCLVPALLLLLSRAPTAASVTCNPSELSPCSGAFFSSAPPSGLCCAKLRQQQPCFCGYLRNPSLSRYINSPNARRVVAVCRVPFPRC